MKYGLILLLWVFSLGLIAQKRNQSPLDSGGTVIHKFAKGEHFMLWQVKSIGDFIGRFNYTHFINGQRMTDSLKNEYPRDYYLMRLFDEEDPRLLHPKRPSDYRKRVLSFTESICQEDITINQRPIMKARVQLKGIYLQKSVEANVVLQKFYQSKDSTASWQIIDIELPQNSKINHLSITNIPIVNTTQGSVSLFPNAQDVSFLALIQMIKANNSVIKLVSANTTLSRSILLLESLLQKQELTFDLTEDVVLDIEINAKYTIELREFSREKENSGFLISNLIQH